jgi:hypothetical protein
LRLDLGGEHLGLVRDGVHRPEDERVESVLHEAGAELRETKPAIKAVVDALLALGENLLEHLDYEELSLKETVLRLGVGSNA